MRASRVAVVAAFLPLLAANHHGEPSDPETRAWWDLASEISGDGFEGRATGTPGHENAAHFVADKLASLGFDPMGDDGGWFQRVPLDEIEVVHATLGGDGGELSHLAEFVVDAQPGLPDHATYTLAYRGYCGANDLAGVAGKLVVCHNTRKPDLPDPATRWDGVHASGAAGIVEIADPGFTIEPPRWPWAHNKEVWTRGQVPEADPFVTITIKAESLGKLLPGHDAQSLIAAGAAGNALPALDGGTVRLSTVVRTSQYTSPNVIGILPGTDPVLAKEVLVLGAHLDGYGFGQAIEGDALYNGTLDNAAYVALLLKLAEMREGEGFKRSIVIGFWTGEELGLHGSRWFVANPTVPLDRVVATLNLDQLRPIFPLERLTAHGRTDSTLGDHAAALASSHGFVLQDDPEPERRLILRTDHRPFMEAGIPFLNFTFGFAPGSKSEEIYRHWYRTGYHKPQDDPAQLMDWTAARTFNDFWLELVAKVADDPQTPQWKPDSALRAKYVAD